MHQNVQQQDGHPVAVRFDANINPALNWKFIPLESKVMVNPGEEIVVNYRATNLGTLPSTGTSTFNVTPVKAFTGVTLNVDVPVLGNVPKFVAR